MPTLEQIIEDKKAADTKAGYDTLATMADNWNMPMSSTSVFQDIAVQEQGRRYQGFWDEFGRSSVGGGLNVGSGITGTLGRGLESAYESPYLRAFMVQEGTAIPYLTEKGGESLKAVSQQLFDKSRNKKWQPAVDGGISGYIASAVGATLPYMAASALSTMATGTPLAAFGVGFAVEGDGAYRDAIANGFTEEQAQMQSIIVGTISGAIESFQVGEIFKTAGLNAAAIKAIKQAAVEKSMQKIGAATGKLTLNIVQNGINEGLQEAAQEATAIIAPSMHGGAINLDEAANRLGKAFVGGATVGAILSGAATPFKIAADGTVTQDDIAPPTAEEIEVQKEEAKIVEAAKIEKAVQKAVVTAATPIETNDTVTGLPPLETKTVGVVEQQNTVINNIAEGKPPATGVVQPNQASMGVILTEMGQSIPSRQKESFAQWMQEAKDQGLDRREIAARIADEVTVTGRALTRQESAGLTLAVVDVRNELQEVKRRLADSAENDNADVDVDLASERRLESEYSRITSMMANAIYESGGEQARDFVARQIAVNKAGDLVSIKTTARKNKKAPLTAKETKAFEKQSKELDKVKAELAALQAKDRETNAETVFKAVKKTAKKRIKKGTKTEMTIQQKAAAVRQLFKDGCVL